MSSIFNERAIEKDCFAYDKRLKKCNALKELVCTYKRCTFYKKQEDVNMNEIERDIKCYEHSNSK